MSPTTLSPKKLYKTPLICGQTTIYENGIVLHLGYRLCLSPTEANILGILMTHALMEPKSYHTAADLSKELAANTKESHTNDDRDHASAVLPCIPTEQLSVHIGRINRKAEVIGGRKLILCRRGQGYRINPYA